MCQRYAAVVLMILALASCTSSMNRSSDAGGLDHILLGVPDLDAGVTAFEQATGVSPVRGGKHPSRGTENALVSLGNGSYLEIIAPQRDTDVSSDLVKQLRGLNKPTLVGWAVHVNDIDAVRAKMQTAGFVTSQPAPGARITPQGVRLEWSTVALEQPAIEAAPFFIQWGASTTHPSKSSPSGCTARTFEVEDPAADTLARLLTTTGMTMHPRSAPRSHMKLILQCGPREATFSSE
jgi:hypothetical protein